MIIDASGIPTAKKYEMEASMRRGVKKAKILIAIWISFCLAFACTFLYVCIHFIKKVW